MDSSYFTNPLEFLINTLFGLYILAVMLRFLLQCVRADFYNPLSQVLVKVTNPALRPLRRVIPGFGGIDLAAVVLMLALQIANTALVLWLAGASLRPAALIVGSIAALLSLLINVYIVSVLIQAVLSWINPNPYNPVGAILYSLNEPLLEPVRRIIPPIAGLDLSPLVVIIALQLLKMLLIPLLFQLAV